MSNKTITIILLTYNHEKYINECLRSLKSQNVKFRLIVVDDASIDNTIKIIKSYNFKRIKFIINKKNKGIKKLSDNYNKGLSLVKTKYVCIIEGDDFWHCDKLKYQINYLKNFDVDFLAVEGFNYIDTSKSKHISPMKISNICWHKYNFNTLIKYLLFKNNFFNVPSSGFLFKTSSLREIGGFWQPKGFQWLDKPTILKMLFYKKKIGLVKKKLSYYRRHENSHTHNKVFKNSKLYDLKLARSFIKANDLDKIRNLLILYNDWKLLKTVRTFAKLFIYIMEKPIVFFKLIKINLE